ncbi:MAG: hypothetical protein GF398_11685 [Chitinivibrionales bacterium]|nr:hypothetical protein [Chitinivibrionales bacterium]
MITRLHSILLLLFCISSAETYLIVPFEDNVKLKDVWNLAEDVPRWFTHAVDTIHRKDSLINFVPFDSVMATIIQNGWTRRTYLSRPYMARLAGALEADYLISGTISTFKVQKQTINTDAPLNATHEFTQNTYGQGGITIAGGLHSYTADVRMEIDIYDPVTATVLDAVTLDTKEKDAGFKMWLPFQLDNPEMNYYHMSRSEFGSSYFQKSVIGIVMNHFAGTLKNKLQNLASAPVVQAPISKEHIEGKILDRVGKDIYIDLGHADNLMHGEILHVYQPQRPFLNEQGDTLGWAEAPAGRIKVRIIKARHFSLATVVEEQDSLRPGWSVRVSLPE